jgi:peptidoglycan/xylan/chitin deacetylase (PgdA/CDA1 family)
VTEKTASVIKENDPLMIKIKEEAPKYIVKATDALINNDTIIPGLYGKEVDISKSYNSMKRIGDYASSLLVYDEVDLKVSLKGKYNKYVVSGNPVKNMISLIFLVDRDDNIDNILNILKEKEIKASFFIDGTWLERNSVELNNIVSAGHTVGNLGYNSDYTSSSFNWMNTIIKKVSKQETGYCYLEERNKDYLDVCSLMKNYTIIPNLVVDNNYLTTIQANVKAGNIIALSLTSSLEQELPLVINYLISKGYKLETLGNHLDERLY